MSEAGDRRLYALLEQNEVLRRKGYSLSYSPDTGIIVDRAGHVHGIWSHGDGFVWMSPGSSEPKFRTENVNSAVLYTVVVLAQQ